MGNERFFTGVADLCAGCRVGVENNNLKIARRVHIQW
jgi:hypothetical protein